MPTWLSLRVQKRRFKSENDVWNRQKWTRPKFLSLLMPKRLLHMSKNNVYECYYSRHKGWPNSCSFFFLKGTTVWPTIVLVIVANHCACNSNARRRHKNDNSLQKRASLIHLAHKLCPWDSRKAKEGGWVLAFTHVDFYGESTELYDSPKHRFWLQPHASWSRKSHPLLW